MCTVQPKLPLDAHVNAFKAAGLIRRRAAEAALDRAAALQPRPTVQHCAACGAPAEDAPRCSYCGTPRKD